MHSTAKELRFHTKELLDSVSRGEEVIITLRGKPYAKLVPLKKSGKNTGTTNELFGMWKERKDLENVGEYVRRMRRERFRVPG
ncbi:MAG: type II toxin-antitoxin system prevent-host-death family antitoxin [Bacteroidetes bacterium]|nr:type II toxin-antitoxin system prevent-host-death family antitoxin [Bacteroidota bacterium]MCL5739061.1 type II toxin-antitoxin system prevent-host-death family antitoxin [Bacteroidota bacterium]